MPASSAILGKRSQPLEAPAYAPFMYFAAKALSTHEAILTLARQRAGLEAAMLSRSLFETGITAFWIIQDVEDRLPMFNAALWHVHRKFNLTARKWRSQIPDDSWKALEASLAVIEPATEASSKRYGRKKPGSWGSVSFREMADSLNLGQRYDFVYSLLSELEHAGPGGMIHYLRQFPSGEVGAILTQSHGMLTAALQESYLSLIMALEAADMTLELGLEAHLVLANSKLEEILGPKSSSHHVS